MQDVYLGTPIAATRIMDGQSSGALRVLLVDDSEDIQRALTACLRGEGFEVASASTAGEALGILRAQDVDVLVTDIGLPDLSGADLIREARRTLRRPLRIIVMTGYGEPHQQEARMAGADIVLTKPVAVNTLTGHLRGARRGSSAA